MSKKIGVVCATLGAVLILSALLLFLYNRYEDNRAGQEAESLLSEVQSYLSKKNTDIKTIPPISSPETIPPEMPVIQVDGHGYVGYISIPALEIELPVMSDWDYSKLKVAPCRQFGSSRTGGLVIAAHNYPNHFGMIGQLKAGDTVVFTDMDGIINTYAVGEIRILSPTSVETVQNSGYDLVLYTCTKGGESRITVFCNKMNDHSGGRDFQ